MTSDIYNVILDNLANTRRYLRYLGSNVRNVGCLVKKVELQEEDVAANSYG